MAFTWAVHNPNHKPQLQGAGSPHPHREADLGLHGLREVTTHSVSWVIPLCSPGPGSPPPAKWATVSPGSPHATKAVGTKASWLREKESWAAQEAGFSGGLGCRWRLWAEERLGEGSPGMECGGMGEGKI